MLKTRISGVGLFLFAALTSFSSAAWALGLGNVTVESYLNQPFKAKVELITRASDDLESISAKLASADDFELIGASLSAIPVPLRFAVVLEEGDAHVLVTSTLPVKDPIIRIIVEVRC